MFDTIDFYGGDIRWLVVPLTLHLVTTRLTFVSAQLKILLKDVCFVTA